MYLYFFIIIVIFIKKINKTVNKLTDNFRGFPFLSYRLLKCVITYNVQTQYNHNLYVM